MRKPSTSLTTVVLLPVPGSLHAQALGQRERRGGEKSQGCQGHPPAAGVVYTHLRKASKVNTDFAEVEVVSPDWQRCHN